MALWSPRAPGGDDGAVKDDIIGGASI